MNTTGIGTGDDATIEEVAQAISEWASRNDQPNPEEAALVPLLNKYFGLSDIESLCFIMGIDDEQLRGQTKDEKARSLVRFAVASGMIPQLKRNMAGARPNLRGQLT